jgi:hypothetical protein
VVVTLTATRHDLVADAEIAFSRVHALVGGGGGSIHAEMLAQIAEAKVVLRGLRFRAPDIWRNVAEEGCIH